MPGSARRIFLATLAAAVLVAVGAGCSSPSTDGAPTTPSSPPPTASTPLGRSVREAPATAAPTTTVVRAFNGRIVPAAPTSATAAAAAFARIERALRTTATAPGSYADLGHEQQIVIRTLARNPDWHTEFLAALPADVAEVAELHLAAREHLSRLHTAPPLASIPAWRIIAPEPLEMLSAHYREAEAATGIDWEILAAINLIETGMGRIVGLSSAGAQGPMQFLPTTWEEVSEGGDIDDPHDAIQGAARYLVRRGGLDDIRKGLWGYNNSDQYVDAVLTYAEMLEGNEDALRGLYNWEIYVGTEVGTLWLPVGFSTSEPLPAADYLADNPWARTL